GIWPVLTEAGDRGIHQPRIDGAQRGRIQPELGESADLEILDQDVALSAELSDKFGALGPRKIDGGRFFAAIAAEEIGRDPFVTLAVPWRTPKARVVARSGALDLDYLGSQVGEQLCAPGPGKHAAEVEDLDSFERPQWRRPHKRRSAITAFAALWARAPITPPPG